MLLVISMQDDFHIPYLVERMAQDQRDNTIVFRTETFPTESSIVLRKNLEDSHVEIRERRINLGAVSSVWYRRPARPIIDSKVEDEDAREYAKKESWNSLLGLWEGMDTCLWVSKPSKIRAASYKWEQLRRAEWIGFATPKTLITNSPDEARKFCKNAGRAIVKAVSRSVFPRGDRYEAAYTTPINFNDPRIAHVAYAPCIFQEHIPKQLELRITIVEELVFACAIYSQESEKTKHDWRNYDLENTPHEAWDLPAEIERKCIELVYSYGLKFGTIDMILTPDKEYVFLELNPNGQWAWIDELTDLPIAEALIDLLF